VWLVPFSLFVALSAGDNVLPSMGSEGGEGSGFGGQSSLPGGKEKGREGMAKALVNGVREWVGEIGGVLGGGTGERKRF